MAGLIYEGPKKLRANQLFRATLRVTLEENIKPGGRIVIAARHYSDFGDPQIDDQEDENYIAISSSRPNLSWKLGQSNELERHPWNNGINLILEKGELKPGDTVSVNLGGDASGCPGYRCQSFSEKLFRFRLGIKQDTNSKWQVNPVEKFPGIEVVGSDTSGLAVKVPSSTDSKKGSRVCVKAEDTYGNIAATLDTEVLLLLDGRSPLKRISLAKGYSEISDICIAKDDRWHHIVALSDEGSFFARSNPFGPSPVEGLQLYWGDIHVMSGFCCGTGVPGSLYSYGRYAAGLDFSSVTIQDFLLSPVDWEQNRTATIKANEPGRFVAFLGYEWSGEHEFGGDHCIYYLEDDGPLIHSGLPRISSASWDDALNHIDRTRTLTDVIQELGKIEAPVMIVPHCGGRPCNLDFYDPRYMPMFEIHSIHRNYEEVAQVALSRGLKVGFIGDSDDHRGSPGDSRPVARDRYFSSRGGLIAAYAKELTRESLWEAFFQRRVYATNGVRIVLDFRINDVLMGGEVTAKAGVELSITFFTRLDGLLDRLELVRGTEMVKRFSGRDNQVV